VNLSLSLIGDEVMAAQRYPGVHIGAAWVSMIEPEVGYEAAFNRWYSDDHFYAGGMCLPGIFAGRRWIATKELRLLRQASEDDMAKYGCFLHLNLFSSHQLNEINSSLSETLQVLGKAGRMYPTEIPRRHLYTAITPYEAAVYRDGDCGEGPKDIHALDYPFAGVVLELIDSNKDDTRADLVNWLRNDFIPITLRNSSSAVMCLIFVHADLPDIIKSPRLPPRYENGGSRVVLLWFLQDDPRISWEKDFARHTSAVSQSGLGNVAFVGPFIPTVPGTNRHIEELR
jgi:hypothetical protein